MIKKFQPGQRLKDLLGVEWTILKSWVFKKWYCLALCKTDQPEITGGSRFEIPEANGGLTVNAR